MCPEQTAGTNPINIAVGNKHQTETDLPSSAITPLHFQRFYNSTGSLPTSLGHNWTHTYAARIHLESAQAEQAAVMRPDGRILYFYHTAETAPWFSQSDITDRLERLTDQNSQPTGWRYTVMQNRSIETYDTAGKLTAIAFADGRHVSLHYSTAETPVSIAPQPGLLIAVQDQDNRSLQFSYDTESRLSALTDLLGQTTIYTYTEDGLLAGVSYPDSSTRQYHYNEPAFINNGTPCSSNTVGFPTALTGLTDQNGTRYATFTYNCSGLATGSSHPDGIDQVKLTFKINSNSSTTTATDPLGNVRTYGFTNIQGVSRRTSLSQPAGSGCAASTAQIGYDTNGNIVNRTDFNGTRTCSAFDLTRNLETVRIEGLTSACPSNLNTAAVATGQRKITTEWHPQWLLVTQRAAPNRIITSVYNGQPDPSNGNRTLTCAPGNAWLPGYLPIAVLCKQIEQPTSDPDGSKGFSAAPTGTARITEWTYDIHGKMLTERTPDGQTLTYTYASATTSTHTAGDLLSVSDQAGSVTTYTRYDRAGRLLESRDPNGVVTRLTYDTRGQLTEHTRAGHTTRYTYTPVGQLHTLTDPDGNTLTHTYDAAHRLTAITDSLGNRITYTLDAAGNLTRETIADPNNQLTRAVTRHHDALQRVQQTVRGQ